MAVLAASGFWSYARDDDSAEGGRITSLARQLAGEYALLTGDDLRMFVDRDDVNWGDAWRDRIDEALAGVTFFIPIVTPRYFRSEECRRELLSFEQRARNAGLGELLLPILYIDVPGLDPDSDDEALAVVARTQWEDWRVLRLVDSDSPQYRQGVHSLATRLMAISELVAERPVQVASAEDSAKRLAEAGAFLGGQDGETSDDGSGSLDEPGLIDVLAETEVALPRWGETINELSEVMSVIGEVTNDATVQMAQGDADGKGFAGRLNVARNLARALAKPADDLLDLGSRYASLLRTVDAGVRTLIEVAPGQAESEDDRNTVRELFQSIRQMALTSRGNVTQLKDFSRILESVGSFSRDLRPTLQTIQDALRRITDGQAVMDDWVREIDEALEDFSPAS